MKKFQCLIAGVIIWTLLSQAAAADTHMNAEKELQLMKACVARRGQWGVFGDVSAARCNLPTSDPDKFCSDRSQCEGDCIATPISDTDKSEIKNGRMIMRQGKCSEWKFVSGCYAAVRQGFVSLECHNPPSGK